MGVNTAAGGEVNVQGEVQKKLDVISNEVFIHRNEWGGLLAGMASEEMEHALPDPEPATRVASTCWCSTPWTARRTSM